MSIDRVEVFLIDAPLPRPRRFSTGGGMTRGAIVVRIQDGDGVVGWGETYPTMGAVATTADVGALLLGRDAGATRGNLGLIRAAAGGNGFVVSPLAIALEDLRARRAGVPVHALYGGARRSRVRAYASSEGYVDGVPSAVAWAAEADRAVSAGFTGFKLRIGREEIGADMAAAEVVRRAHPDLDLIADGNGAYTVRQAVQVGRALDDLEFRWLEEPTPTERYADYERVRDALPLPLAGGESVQDRGEAADLIDRGAFDLIQPDPCICGGIGETIAIAGLARLAAVPTHPHCCNGALNIAATLQVIAALPDPTRLTDDPPLLEHDFGPNIARTDLLTEPLTMREGWFDVPTGPGLGVDVDEAFVRRVAVARLERPARP